MGFKVNESFLRFLTMGAAGATRVAHLLTEAGFSPIELERYSMSNKIWTTKIKRIRLPDLLCIRTGLRVEVRAKSDLKIRMSDSPKNADRAWDAGLNGDDLVAFIAFSSEDSELVPAMNAEYFQVSALRDSVGASRLGPAKSASEGAERDRTWPATVASRPGTVTQVSAEKLRTCLHGDGLAKRNQTYSRGDKFSYVRVGDSFPASSTFLAGVVPSKADISVYLGQKYNPLLHVASTVVPDRYAAVKALGKRVDLASAAKPVLEQLLPTEPDSRVQLEAAGSAALLGLGLGQEVIANHLFGDSKELSMEAVLLLSEIGGSFARELLNQVLTDPAFVGLEQRQAAVWGLGRGGLGAYNDVLPYIADGDENVALHAITALDTNVPDSTIDQLIECLCHSAPRGRAAAMEALVGIGTPAVLRKLAAVARSSPDPSYWVLATIGRFGSAAVRAELSGSSLLDQVEPILLVSGDSNWLFQSQSRASIEFLRGQTL